MSASETAPKRRHRRSRRRGLTFCVLLLVLLAGAGLMGAQVGLWRGRVAIEERRHEDAETWLQLAGLCWPRGAEWHFLAATVARRQENFDQVERHLRQAHQLGWPVNELEYQQSLAHAQTGQFRKVDGQWAELFRNAGSDGPEICEAYVKFALARFRLAEAATVIESWKADFPDDAGPWLVEGTLNSVLLRWADAEARFRQALELDSDLTEARRKLATALIKQLKFDQAEHQLRIVADTHATADVYADLAHCMAQQGQLDDALQVLQQALQNEPKNVRLLAEYGQLKLMQKDSQAAIDALSQVVAQQPENTEVRYSLAQALRNLGREEQAGKHFALVDEGTRALLKLAALTSAVVADPHNVEKRFQVAETTWRWKSRQDGAAWLHSVLEFDPHHEAAHALLAKHYELTGDAEKAAYHKAQSEADHS